MSASLVGSEMCIRDRPLRDPIAAPRGVRSSYRPSSSIGRVSGPDLSSVSYTHLTLPTICSV
eukprot:9909740-Alexandrium_andersonii.AAC.1